MVCKIEILLLVFLVILYTPVRFSLYQEDYNLQDNEDIASTYVEHRAIWNDIYELYCVYSRVSLVHRHQKRHYTSLLTSLIDFTFAVVCLLYTT